jgi:hypothetical protein
MAGLPPKAPKPLNDKEQQKLDRLAKKSGRRAARRLAGGDNAPKRKRR